ncbi:MAG: hypothetical protein M1118_09270 [Chloroflexi bacterium]|nr:hypothetical protein [Chloroflexota bacterium]
MSQVICPEAEEALAAAGAGFVAELLACEVVDVAALLACDVVDVAVDVCVPPQAVSRPTPTNAAPAPSNWRREQLPRRRCSW